MPSRASSPEHRARASSSSQLGSSNAGKLSDFFPAASAVATDVLARPNARQLAILGYGEQAQLTDKFAGCEVISKPYGQAEIVEAFKRMRVVEG